MSGKDGRIARQRTAMVLLVLALAMPLAAQVAKRRASSLDDLAFAKPELRVQPAAVDLDSLRALGAAEAKPLAEAFDAFLSREGGSWVLLVDRSTGRPLLLEGQGIPWIPGANALSYEDLGLRAPEVPLDWMEGKVLSFINTHPGLFGVDASDLVLNKGASGPIGGYLYFLDFGWTYRGLPVEGAHVVFRLNHGNLVQMGAEGISDSIQWLDPVPYLSPETAAEIAGGFVGGFQEGDELLGRPALSILPVSLPPGDEKAAFDRLSYRLVWTVAFHREGVVGNWETRVDAHTGEVLSFRDTNDYGKVHGGVYPNDRPAAEVDRPFAFADIGGGLYSDAGGLFTGNDATSTLSGQYVRIQDVTCGAGGGAGTISLTTTTGNLDFGMSAGRDCVTPGVGGTGNTHAARTQFYQVNLIKMKARSYLPANAWLSAQLTDRVNINDVCNAYWSSASGTVNFFKYGVYGSWTCENTGELPGVSLHEWGHGMDYNDGNGASPDKGTGETYGDFTAVLQTHNSCAGNGFFIGANCSGYGDPCLSCSGIRDIDYAKHASNTPAVPTMLSGTTGFHCPTSGSYYGPCGYEGHCESYISSEAMWDLAVRDLVTWGLDLNTAWLHVDKLWYRSRSTSGSAYTCPSLATTHGCGAANYFSTFRVIDDDDGNLANGTPHASAIFAAFNRHAIACTSVVNTDSSACPSVGTPVLVGTAGSNSNSLSWGAVTNASTYDVYRNESDCDAGFTRIATVTAPTASYVDSAAIDGLTYYYRIQAVGSNISCFSALSNCVTLTPYTPSGVLQGTVTEQGSGLPLMGALIHAESGGLIYEATTDLSGNYQINPIAVGSYDVTASLFGYLPQTVNGVAITEGATTTQNFALAGAPSHVVSGTVYDVVTEWPVYASVQVTGSGYPGATVWTDPVTGFYSITLVDGITYTLTASSFIPGYESTLATVTPLGSDVTQDLPLSAAAAPCTAPGYTGTGLFQNLDTTTPPALPAGWAMVRTGGTNAATAWATRAGTRYPSGYASHSAPNLVYFNSFSVTTGNNARLYYTVPLDLTVSGDQLSFWMFHDTGYSSSNDRVQVQVSTDGGTVWQDVGSPISRYLASSNYWSQHTVTLAGFTGSPTSVLVGIHGISAYGNDIHLDDIQVGTPSCNAPASGGLIVGNVLDQNTGLGLTGTVTTNTTTGASMTAVGTGADPAVAEGFFWFYGPEGTNDLTATRTGYSPGSTSVSVPHFSTVRADMLLGAGQITPTPATVDVTVAVNSTDHFTLRLDNTGTSDVNYTINETGSRTLLLPNAWTVLPSASTGVSRPAGAAVGGYFYMIGGESTGGGRLGLVQRYDPAANAWDTALPAMPTGVSNITAAILGSDIYVVAGSGAAGTTSALQVFHTASGTWETVTTDPYPQTAYGVVLAAHGGRLYAFGGYTTVYLNNAYVYDPAAAAGSRWTALPAAPVSGAWGGATAIGDRVFWAGMRNATADLANVVAYDVPSNTWVTYPNLPAARGGAGVWTYGAFLVVGGGGWSAYSTAVYEYDTNQGTGGTWSTTNSLNTGRRTFAFATSSSGQLYAAGGWSGSYLTAAEMTQAFADCPWLFESPLTGTIPPGFGHDIDLTFDTTGLTPGTSYQTDLFITNDAPYGSLLVPVTLHVTYSPLVASASAAPTSGTAPLAVAFTGGATGGDGAYTFEWDFGDGSAHAYTQDANHTYLAPGTFTASLTVTDGQGWVDTDTVDVTVTVPFDSSFYDDAGRAQVCVWRQTGIYQWTILTGPSAGTTYTGICVVANGGTAFWSTAGDPVSFYVTYDSRRRRARGYLSDSTTGVYSAIVDSNTTNNPPCP